MNYSLKYIRKLANLLPTISNQVILEALNNLGFEVENSSKFINAKNLIIGTIIKIDNHPNADILKILQINIGAKDIQILTGAQNIKVGKQVIVCLPGSKCNNVEYKTMMLRGIESNGMLASLGELGIDSKYLPKSSTEGIELLEPIYRNGDNILKSLNLDDVIITINILPNRGDIHGYYFIVMELSAYFNTKTNFDFFTKSNPTFKSDLKVSNGLSNHISLLEAKALKGESSFSDKILLIKSNIMPINKTVDLSNMAFILFGQVVHIYDKDKIGKNFDCKLFSGNVTIANNDVIKLDNNLIIINDKKPISLAGVVGLTDTMITNETKNIIFEISNFDPKYIRKTFKQTKIDNIFVNRNTKSSSLNIIPIVIIYLGNSLKEFSYPINNYIIKRKTIEMNNNDINEYAGFNITENHKYSNVVSFLKNIGYEIHDNQYTLPFYRYDIDDKYGIVEDIFRGYGFNNIPKIQPNLFSSIISIDDNIKKIIANQNYSEIITYSLHNKKYNEFNPFKILREIKIKNYFSLNKIIYRHTLINSMIKIGIKNTKYKIDKFSIFEIGYINGYFDNKHLGLISTIKNLNEIKTDVATLLNGYGKVEFRRTKYEHLHEGISTDVYLNSKYIGFIGKFRPTYLKLNFWIAEIELPTKKISQNNISEKYVQLITRDLTINLGKKDDIAPHIEELKRFIDIIYIDLIDSFDKNENERTVTFKFYLDEENSKIFDAKYK